jgi:L-asparaginase / beta-aspartyl-peptidase
MIAFARHGGAGAKPGRDYSHEIAHMQALCGGTRQRLNAGAMALDVVCETLKSLEESGLYVAGRGAPQN